MYKFSIIIPHKNTPELLVRLLKSIPLRDDLEVIIVDDNSDSNIVRFEDFPGAFLPNLKKILTKEGLGAGYARNVGLSHASGHWVYFADADDIFSEKFDNLLNEFSEDYNTDMVIVNAKKIDENQVVTPIILNRYIDNFKKKKYRSLEVLKYGFWSPWSRLIKRSIFTENNIEFEQVRVGNDQMAILLATYKSKLIKVFSSPVYLYYKPFLGSQTDDKYKLDDVYFERLERQFRVNDFYNQIRYPFPLPIIRGFRNKNLNRTEKAQAILNKYKYNRLSDIYSYIKYLCAKSLRII